jgi:hypothetical protein
VVRGMAPGSPWLRALAALILAASACSGTSAAPTAGPPSTDGAVERDSAAADDGGPVLLDAHIAGDAAVVKDERSASVPPDAIGPTGHLDCGGVGGINALLPRHWCAVRGSHLADVTPTGAALEAVRGNSGPAAIISAWSGGALDGSHDRLIVWGGGHMDYAGNEVYAFDLHTLRWTRASDPSLDVGGDERSGVYPDGRPRSRHTYNSLQYVPAPLDRFCAFGAGGFFPSGQTGDGRIQCFDLAGGTWSLVGEVNHGGGTGALSAVDPIGGHVWTHGTASNAYFSEFDPVTRQTIRHAPDSSGFFSYSFTAAIEPRARRFVAIGGNEVRTWDLGHPDVAWTTLLTTGGEAVVKASNPGFDYDSVRQRLVAWSGGADVYSLDLAARGWTREAAASDNTVIPTPPSHNGTFGRFRYVRSMNVFVLVNAIDEDVYVYRLAP